jgi:ribosome-associated protein
LLESKPSKSALKRQDQALKALGEELVGLSPGQLDQLPLDERLRDAIDAAGHMRAHGALRRQRQLIGKLLRSADAEAIRAALTALTAESVVEKRRFRRAEEWRDRLVAESHAAIGECVEATGCDETLLREAVKQTERARSDRAVKTARRELFRLVYAALEHHEGQR